MHQPVIRLAREGESPALRAMHARSLRALGAEVYSAAQIEAALAVMGTLDDRLIADGTYWVVELDGVVAGSAGYSRRLPDYTALIPQPPRPLPEWHNGIATVRSVFVDPCFARRGLGRLLMGHVEEEMRAAGAETAELMATLAGVPLYGSLGYRAFEGYALRLREGVWFPVERMAKRLIEDLRMPVAA